MKFKLDENIGRHGWELLSAAGHDVMTVRAQGLGGATDEKLFEICASEGRALITLDHDFGHVTRFPPETSSGIVVLETGPRVSVPSILDRLTDFLAVLEKHSVRARYGSSSPVGCASIYATAIDDWIGLPMAA